MEQSHNMEYAQFEKTGSGIYDLSGAKALSQGLCCINITTTASITSKYPKKRCERKEEFQKCKTKEINSLEFCQRVLSTLLFTIFIDEVINKMLKKVK